MGLGLGLHLGLGLGWGICSLLGVNRLAGHPNPSQPNPEHANPNPGERTCRMLKGAGMRDGALASV